MTVRDAGKLRATDAEQLAYAVSEARTLVTHNRADFEALVQNYFALGQMHYVRSDFCSSSIAVSDRTTITRYSQSSNLGRNAKSSAIYLVAITRQAIVVLQAPSDHLVDLKSLAAFSFCFLLW